jgi:hypothetical protein
VTEAVTILVALIGAVGGSLGAVWLAARHRRLEEERARQRVVVERHLFQLQDAVESLWHRLDNLKNDVGRSVMSDDYFAQTTLYALGRVLAIERILGLGVYAEIARDNADLAEFLRTHRLDPTFEHTGFYKYDRLTLAELVLDREGERFRPSLYVEFRKRYESPESVEQHWLAPARDKVAKFDDQQLEKLMQCLEPIAGRLARETELPTSIPGVWAET